MSVKKVGINKWRIVVSVRVKGKPYPVVRKETFTGTKTEAECRKADIVRELKSGGSLTQHNSSIRTFRDAVKIYAEKLRMEGKLSPSHERKIIRIEKDLGHIRVEAFAEYFESYRRHLINTPTVGGKKRRPATINRPTEIVRAVFNHLVALERVLKNPITKIRFPKIKEESRKRYLTQGERLALFNAIEQHRPHILPIIAFMIMVPCRVSELTTAKRLQYCHFDRTIFIPTSKADISIVKPIPPPLYGYFDSLPEGCGWLFYRVDEAGKYHPIFLRKAWLFCLKIAGIADFRIHDLRHMAVTDMLKAGNLREFVALVAGWKSTDMINNYFDQDQRQAASGVTFNHINAETYRLPAVTGARR